MSKTLCDWSKSDIEKHVAKLRALTANPRFYCRKCARVAATPDILCKPKCFPDSEPDSDSSGPAMKAAAG